MHVKRHLDLGKEDDGEVSKANSDCAQTDFEFIGSTKMMMYPLCEHLCTIQSSAFAFEHLCSDVECKYLVEPLMNWEPWFIHIEFDEKDDKVDQQHLRLT
jgi:hypothetical protein